MFFKHLVFVISVLSFVHSTPSCGENEVYTNCMSPCKLQQCKHLKQIPDCDTNIKCQPGCECIQNFLRNSDNVCISSEICEEYDTEFDPEKDIDVILNDNDDDEATNEYQVVDNTVSSQDGLTKETESGSKMISNTEEVENTEHDTEDDEQDINGIQDYLSFEEEMKNGDWVMEQTEHKDTNQGPNTDQQKLDNKESEMDTERSTEKQTVQAPENEDQPTTGKKLNPEETESNRTEPNQINIEDNTGNTKLDQNVDNTLETSTRTEKNELPIKRPVTEVYPEDKKDTNQWPEPPRPGHDDQPNKTRPEQNTDESRESTNMPENNEWPNRRPGTEVNPEDREDTNQWPEPPRPWHGEQPYTTSKPEQNTKPWYPYIPKRKWNGSKHYKRPTSRNNPITIIYPYPIFIDKSNERHSYPDARPKYERGHERGHARNREYYHDRDRGHERSREYDHDRDRGHERNREYDHDRDRGHERNGEHESDRDRGHERNDKHGYDRERGQHGRNREPERRRENKYDRNREPERRRENEYDRNREPERRREHENGHDRSSHRRPRTWCRNHPGDKRRPCPRYKPKHDSHRDYKNKEHNSNHDRSYKRPTRVCKYQRHGKPICYVRKDSRRN